MRWKTTPSIAMTIIKPEIRTNSFYLVYRVPASLDDMAARNHGVKPDKLQKERKNATLHA
jgi:hypothetical protein